MSRSTIKKPCGECGQDVAAVKRAKAAALPRGTFVVATPDPEHVAAVERSRYVSGALGSYRSYVPMPTNEFARVLSTFVEADGAITVVVEDAQGRSRNVPIARIDPVLPLA